jgi:hypothetical protein
MAVWGAKSHRAISSSIVGDYVAICASLIVFTHQDSLLQDYLQQALLHVVTA